MEQVLSIDGLGCCFSPVYGSRWEIQHTYLEPYILRKQTHLHIKSNKHKTINSSIHEIKIKEQIKIIVWP